MSLTSKPSTPPSPQGVQAGQAGQSALDYTNSMANPAMYNQLLGVDQSYRQPFAQLNIDTLGQYMNSGLGQYGNAVQQTGNINQQALNQQYGGMVGAMNQYGGQITQAMKNANPALAQLANNQTNLANQLYAQGQQLTPDQSRSATQQALAAGAASGRIGDNSSVASQILGRDAYLKQNQMLAQNAGQNAYSMNQQFSNPIMSILGQPAAAMQYGQNQQNFGLQQNQQNLGSAFITPSNGINLALQNAANMNNYNASIYGANAALAGAQAQAQGAMIGGAMSGLGAAAGGMFQGAGAVGSIGGLFCWVAREVYGSENPQWLAFRHWMFNYSPKWFLKLYATHGEKFAQFISNKPILKSIIKKWMDGRIASLNLSYA